MILLSLLCLHLLIHSSHESCSISRFSRKTCSRSKIYLSYKNCLAAWVRNKISKYNFSNFNMFLNFSKIFQIILVAVALMNEERFRLEQDATKKVLLVIINRILRMNNSILSLIWKMIS